jgi:hypothetical protein
MQQCHSLDLRDKSRVNILTFSTSLRSIASVGMVNGANSPPARLPLLDLDMLMLLGGPLEPLVDDKGVIRLIRPPPPSKDPDAVPATGVAPPRPSITATEAWRSIPGLTGIAALG